MIQDNSERPDISLSRIGLAFDHFRGEVKRGAYKAFGSQYSSVHGFRNAKISDFDFTVFGQENICPFEISVNNLSILEQKCTFHEFI